MPQSSSKRIPRRPANLTVRKDLLDAAREAGMNLSAVLEEALAEKVARMKREQWLRENREAVEAYNELVQGQGSFGDSVRSF